MTSVPIKVVLSDLWADLSGAQKFVAVALGLVIVFAVAGSWLNTFRTWDQIRGLENAAIEAKREKDDALEQAAKVASTIKIREEELAKVEVKRDAKKQEIDKARSDVARDRAEYDAAVKYRRQDIPSTDELCRQLAAVNHPCR